MFRIRISSDNLSTEPLKPLPIDPRSMRMDAHTFRDLEIFEAAVGQSLYDLINVTRTSGGAKLLRVRMKKPWCRPERIRAVQDSLRYLTRHRSAFDRLPTDTATTAIERYLRRSLPLVDATGRLKLMLAAFEMRSNDMRSFGRITQGVLSVLAAMRALRATLADLGDEAAEGEVRGLLDELRAILERPDLSGMPRRERWDLPGWKILELDRTLRGEGRDTVRRLLQIVYELDALVAMADTVERLGLVLPEIVDGPLAFEGEDVFHPFIEGAVPNPVRLDQEKRMLFLTGPNMAGKTTYIRAAGITLYLAHLGMGVPARSFRFSPCQQLFTSIMITDNVRAGVSFFRAEALRMKAIAQAVSQEGHVVALMDEPFKGTNLKDALDASRAILERLAEREENLFMVASHLIELGERIAATGNVDCRLFEASEDEGRLRFEYVLRPGISSQRLGMRVLREEGIFELLDGATAPVAT